MTDGARLLDVRTVRILLAGVAALVLANLINHLFGDPFWPITQQIDLGSDRNPAAWYSSILLIVAAAAAVQCGRVAGVKGIDGGRTMFLVAALLALMSCDEIARIHETLGAVIAERVGVGDKSFAQHARWVWVLGPVVVAAFGAIIAISLRTLLRVPGTTRLFIMGFGMIVIGGVVLESTINFLNHEELQWLWKLEIVVEEALEMAGTIWILMALVHWRDGVERSAAADPAVEAAARSDRPREIGGVPHRTPTTAPVPKGAANPHEPSSRRR